MPDPGAAGPFSVTDHGVPFGYRHDLDGAALAAVNAVVAGRYLAATLVDPWSALGFLADPEFAAATLDPTLDGFMAALAEQAEALIRGVDGLTALRAEQLTGLPQLQIAVNEDFVQPTVDAIIKGGRSGESGPNAV